MSAHLVSAQTPRGAKKVKGPRALGVLELGPKGKARLIPITILLDGQYYDATAYKASPVPIALWSGTVYEGFRSGVSQGLFTVTGALENPQTKEWLGEGSWVAAGSMPAKSAKKAGSAEPRGLNDDSGPPVLRRAGAEAPKPPETAPAPPVAQTPPQPAPATPAPAAPSTPAPAIAAAAAPPADAPAPEDPNRPTLKRGKPAAKPPEPFFAPVASAPQPGSKVIPAPNTPAAAAKTTPMDLIPAISDAAGPEPQSYKYEMKPDDENQSRSRVLAFAADDVWARAQRLSGATKSASPVKTSPKTKPAPKPPQPTFSDVQFRAFDLSNSNEPIFVVTAAARLPQSAKGKAEPAPQTEFLVSLVVREDINGDFHKILSNVTDTDHLDVLPRMDFIDAVDADGDGRGELLFRQVSDAGSAFIVYRVIGNQLWTLFQGTPGS